MFDLGNLPAPAKNGFQLLYCTVCGAVIGLRSGGQAVSGGDTEADLRERFALHDRWHRSLAVVSAGEGDK